MKVINEKDASTSSKRKNSLNPKTRIGFKDKFSSILVLKQVWN
jgi:hypothetical protein